MATAGDRTPMCWFSVPQAICSLYPWNSAEKRIERFAFRKRASKHAISSEEQVSVIFRQQARRSAQLPDFWFTQRSRSLLIVQ
jgi:hypothetical protein